MKKKSMRRATALLLAVLMVVSAFLADAPEALAALGDKINGDTKLDTDINTQDTVALPIKIYDYLNDGMLFEYAEAQDPGYYYGRYAEGAPMPYTYLGNDYTLDTNDLYTEDVYDEYAYYYWIVGQSPFEATKVATVDYETPRYLRLQYDSDYTSNGNRYSTYVSDFYKDNGAYQDKDLVQYIAIVYRTTASGSITFGWDTYNTNGTYSSYENINTGNLTFSASSGSGWKYAVYDLYNGTIKSNWDSIESVGRVRITFPMDTLAETIDISHIAYFPTAEAALKYGEAAVAFDENPGMDLSGEGYSGGATKPTVNKGLDFTLSAAHSSKTVSSMRSVDMNVTQKGGVEGVMYVRITNDDSDNPDWAIITDFSNDLGGAVSKEDAHYLVMVYRTSGTLENKIGFGVTDSGYGAGYNDVTCTKLVEFQSSTNWTYLVYDLDWIDEVDNWYTKHVSEYDNVGIYFPGFTSSSQYIDISHVAYFSSETDAENFGAAAVAFDKDPGVYSSDGFGWNMGNNRAYGMLRASNGGGWEQDGDPYQNEYTTYAISKDSESTGIIQANSYNTGEIDMSDYSSLLGYSMHATMTGGIATIGLLEPALGENGTPVYRKEAVDYIAELLKNTLPLEKTDKYGDYNYNYVQGTASSLYGGVDLATALRDRITEGLGSYSATVSAVEKETKTLIGTWDECQDSIKTYTDAAYFLLNNIFTAGSYNTPQDTYNYLVLSEATTEDGVEAYVFDAGFTDSSDPNEANTSVYYDTTNKTISNTSAADKTMYIYEGNTETTLYPFLPVTESVTNNDDGTQTIVQNDTESPYFRDPGVTNTDKGGGHYDERNFNYVMEAEGEFIYYAEDDLFFEFEGDDDVYLFINDQLVLDIGGAHSITGEKFSLNDYVEEAKKNVASGSGTARDEALAIEDGEKCSFKFYYMERHGYGANMRIVTNIRVTDPKMDTTKTAYQNGEQIEYGGIVDEDKPVEYGFSITNNSVVMNNASKAEIREADLYKLSFYDPDIGVKIDWESGLTIADGANGETVFDTNGETLEVTDLYAIVSGVDPENNEKYEDITVTFEDNDALISFLTNLETEGLIEKGGGLWVGNTVTIRGFAYKLTDAQKKDGVFDNTVHVTSYNKDGAYLSGQAHMRVYVPAEPMYYQWSGHQLSVNRTKFVADIKAAAITPGNPLSEKSSIIEGITASKITLTPCKKDGTTDNYGGKVVQLESGHALGITFDTVGSHLIYVNVEDTATETSIVVIPVVVIVADVEDSVYVLDYGLEAELTGTVDGKIELFKNDSLTDLGQATKYQLMGIAVDVPETEEETSSNKNPSYYGDYSLDNYNENKLNRIEFTPASESNVTYDTDSDGNIDGTYSLAGTTLSFKPGDFMDDEYSIWTAVTVYDAESKPSDLGSIDINNEVQMYKKVTTLPATVVYYEDDFPAIKYNDSINNITSNCTSSNLKQSVDQNEQYGHDAVYEAGTNLDKSNGSIHTLKIDKDYGVAATFEFTGTGFELISRTNAYNENGESAAIIWVDVYQYSKTETENKGTLVKSIPVINEFDNGGDGGNEAIYQVPVIRVKDMAYGKYVVDISGVPTYISKELKTTYLYLDGIRIYQPLADEKDEDGNAIAGTNDNYLDTEDGATFKEIRNLIVGENTEEGDKVSKVAVVTYDDTVGLAISQGTTTWVENRNGDFGEVVEEDPDEETEEVVYYVNETTTTDEYLKYGPNNEVYLEGDSSVEALVFYVNEAEGTADEECSLQIAVRRIDAELFTTGNVSDATETPAVVKVGVSDGANGYAWKEIATVTSSTEQYYKIDYTQCPYVEEKGYQVAISLESGMASFTTLKYNGLTLSANDYGDATELYYENGILVTPGIDEEGNTNAKTVDPAAYPAFFSLREQMTSTTVLDSDSDNTEVETPDTDVPESEVPDGDDTEVDTPEVDEPEIEIPDVDEGETGSKPETPEQGGTEIETPDGDDTETEEPDGDDTETEEPDGDDTETEEPDGDDTETEEPDGDDTETKEPDGDDTEVEKPDTEQPAQESIITKVINWIVNWVRSWFR